MISKWVFTPTKISRRVVGANRWTAPVITLDGDHDKYNRFVRQDRTTAYLMLITHTHNYKFDDVALSALNKFTSLRETNPFAPPPHDLSILRGIQVPQSNTDRHNQQLFLKSLQENMEVSKAHLKDGVTGNGFTVNGQFTDQVTRAVCHVSSALIPNMVCVIDEPSVYTNPHEAIKEQLEVLGLGGTITEANDKGIIVRTYTVLK